MLFQFGKFCPAVRLGEAASPVRPVAGRVILDGQHADFMHFHPVTVTRLKVAQGVEQRVGVERVEFARADDPLDLVLIRQ